MIDLLTHRKQSVPIVFASRYVIDCYKSHLPNNNVFLEFNEEKLKEIMTKQMNERGKDEKTEIVIAFDDITAQDTVLLENETVRDLVKYGSSCNITTIFSAQHARVFDDTFRRNVDYVLSFHDNLLVNQRALYERYGDTFENFETFKSFYFQCCFEESHRCLVIDMKTPWKKPNDGIYWYKSPSNLIKKKQLDIK